ncbi:hypothetical protein FRC01_009796, partial [Tulasnella sp. 417]
MARLWIIVWEDGTLSHNLPSNIATDVEDYCQLQHSLKANSNGPNHGRPKPRKARHPQNNQPGTSSSAQANLTQNANGLTTPEIYVPPKKLKTTLRVLSSSDWPDSVEHRK